MKLGIKGKIVLSIEITVFLVTVFALTISYFVLVDVFRQQTYSLLGSVSALKENGVKEFLNEAVSEIEYFNNRETVRKYLLPFMSSREESDKKILAGRVQDLLRYKKIFFHVTVMDKSGVIVYSSNPPDEGKIRAEEDYFTNAMNGTYIQDFYYDLDDKQAAMVVGTPIRDDEGQFVGVLAGQLNVETINMLMTQRLGLGKTGETFLVNSFNLAVTDLLKQPGSAMKKTIYLPQIIGCLQGRSSNFNLPDYNGDSVFGYYHWSPELRSCLVTKIDYTEAMAPAWSILLTLFIVFVGGGMVLGVLGYIEAQTIVSPIKKLHEVMLAVKGGNLDVRSEIRTRDEIGEMSKSFDEMAQELKMSYAGLEEKVKEKTRDLEEKVDELSKMNKVMIGRELRMVELKKALREKEKNNG